MRLVCLCLAAIIGVYLLGCAPVRDTAGKVSGEFGEVSDELGRERHIGGGEEAIIIHPQADKKIKMNF